jgi:hypothetical protein
MKIKKHLSGHARDLCDHMARYAHAFNPPAFFAKGPWVVSLVVNIAPCTIKQTDVFIHNDPKLLEIVQNTMFGNNYEVWSILITISPFTVFDHASQFSLAWKKDTRGSKSRIATGFRLYLKYKQQSDLQNLEIIIPDGTESQRIKKYFQFLYESDNVFSIISECDPQEYFSGDNKYSLQLKEELKLLVKPKEKFIYSIPIQVNSDEEKLKYWSDDIKYQDKTIAWLFKKTNSNIIQEPDM